MVNISQLLNGITSSLNQAASSGVSALSGLVPAGWGTAIALLLMLPLVGVFAGPLLRLGAAVTQSVSAIVVAVLMCVSAWVILVIAHLTDMSRALRPGPKTRPVLLLLVVGGIAVLAVIAFQRSERSLNSCVVGGAILGECLARHNAVRF